MRQPGFALELFISTFTVELVPSGRPRVEEFTEWNRVTGWVASQRAHQLVDGWLHPLVKDLGHVVGDFHAIHSAGAENDLPEWALYLGACNTGRVEADLYTHVTRSCIGFEVDIRLFERRLVLGNRVR